LAQSACELNRPCHPPCEHCCATCDATDGPLPFDARPTASQINEQGLDGREEPHQPAAVYAAARPVLCAPVSGSFAAVQALFMIWLAVGLASKGQRPVGGVTGCAAVLARRMAGPVQLAGRLRQALCSRAPRRDERGKKGLGAALIVLIWVVDDSSWGWATDLPAGQPATLGAQPVPDRRCPGRLACGALPVRDDRLRSDRLVLFVRAAPRPSWHAVFHHPACRMWQRLGIIADRVAVPGL